MSERVTIETVRARVANLNRRLDGVRASVVVERRNGYVALDEYDGETCMRTLVVGSTREISEYVHAMVVGIDLANPKGDS